MALETITNINIDFVKQEYLMIKAKQYDNRSRFICITCYNNGSLCPLDATEHVAYVTFKKADGHFVFNFCTIDSKGRILVELTEQMLAAIGTCYAEIKVVNKGRATVDVDTGEIFIDDDAVLTTMTFYVDVCEGVVDTSLVESDDAFLELNEMLVMLTSDFEDVVKTSKSWAKGDTGVRENEDIDNSMYYSKVSQSYAVGSSGLDERVDVENEDNSKHYYELSKSYAVGGAKKRADEDVDNSKYYYKLALTSETNAKTSETNAKISETNAKTSETNASDSANLSKSYAVGGTGTRLGEDDDNAKYYYEAANKSALNSYDNYKMSESYAVGGTHYRENEAKDNAKFYYEESLKSAEAAKTSETNAENSATSAATSAISADSDAKTSQYYAEQAIEAMNGVGSIFLPGGTISNIDELSAMLEMMLANGESPLGYVYNIMEGFISDDRFMYTGRDYAPGTLVYYGVDGLLHCFEGFMVTGVKGDKESIYRMGSVNITAANVGAVATTDVATVSEMKNYLGI